MSYVVLPDGPEALGPRYRERPVELKHAAIISVDMQNADCAIEKRRTLLDPGPQNDGYRYFHNRLETLVVPNQRQLHATARQVGIENIYVIIESLTKDGRDRGLDHKASLINNPRGSWEAKVIDEVAPADDDIIIRKTASGPFGTTNLAYVLKSMDIRYLIVFGVLSDQCVENTVRVGADTGYLITLVADACATYSEARQKASEHAIKGYCRIQTTDQVVTELEELARVAKNSRSAA